MTDPELKAQLDRMERRIDEQAAETFVWMVFIMSVSVVVLIWILHR